MHYNSKYQTVARQQPFRLMIFILSLCLFYGLCLYDKHSMYKNKDQQDQKTNTKKHSTKIISFGSIRLKWVRNHVKLEIWSFVMNFNSGLWAANSRGAIFIPGATSIPESRVYILLDLEEIPFSNSMSTHSKSTLFQASKG